MAKEGVEKVELRIWKLFRNVQEKRREGASAGCMDSVRWIQINGSSGRIVNFNASIMMNCAAIINCQHSGNSTIHPFS